MLLYSFAMDEENSVQNETPKMRIGVSEAVSSPDVRDEPAFSEVPSDAGSQPVCAEAAADTKQKDQEEPEKSEPLEHPAQKTLSDFESQSGEGSPKYFGTLPLVLRARAYGRTYTKKNGQIGGSVCFRLPWRQITTTNWVGFEEQKLYRVSGVVEGVFDFRAHFLASENRQIIIYVPVKHLDRIRPLEVQDLTISSVEEIETKKPVSEILDGIHVSSWRRFAKSKLVDDESEEDFGEGPPRQLNEIERAWLAGVIDGEGSIFIVKLTRGLAAEGRRGFSYVPAINLSSSSEGFTRRVREIIGKGSVNFAKENREGWKDRWLYRGAGLVLRGLLPQLLPHLLIKKQNAEAMLQYLSFVDANPIDGKRRVIPRGYYETLDSLYFAIKKLNEKGKDSEPIEALLSQPSSLKHRRRGDRAIDCREMTDQESAWLAGVVDGEGSVFLSKITHPAYRRGFFYRPQMMVSNSNRPFLVKAMEIIGEGTVHLAKRGEGGWKTRWEYQGTAGVMRKILPQIIPYMIVKRAQAQMILEYFDFISGNPIIGKKEITTVYYERLDELYFKIKKLNEKGKPIRKREGLFQRHIGI